MPSRKLAQGPFFMAKPFGPAHHDAVGDDQSDKDGQLLADFEQIGPQKLIDHDHQRGDDRHLDDDANAAGNVVADQADREVREGGHQGDGDRHDQGRLQLDRDRQRRTDPQHLQRDRIVVEQRIQQDLLCLRLITVLLLSLLHFGADGQTQLPGGSSPRKPLHTRSALVRSPVSRAASGGVRTRAADPRPTRQCAEKVKPVSPEVACAAFPATVRSHRRRASSGSCWSLPAW